MAILRVWELEFFFLTFSIRIVADFGSIIFQFTTIVVADYNAYIYYYFGYYFYTLFSAGFSFRKLASVGKTYSFTIFVCVLAGANCECVWLM